jgi:hypothetical protein
MAGKDSKALIQFGVGPDGEFVLVMANELWTALTTPGAATLMERAEGMPEGFVHVRISGLSARMISFTAGTDNPPCPPFN